MITLNLMIFTDWTSDPWIQFNIGGWTYCTSIVACLLYNFYYVFGELYRSIRLIYIKMKKQIGRQLDNKAMDIELKQLARKMKETLQDEEFK